MSGLHWQEWFDDYVVELTAVRRPYLQQSIFLLNASRIITTRICLTHSADEKDLKSLHESISEALKAADHSKLKTKRTDQIFHKADEAIETICRKYNILELGREKNLNLNRDERKRMAANKLVASSRSRGTTIFLMTFWPANMNNWQHTRYTLEYVVEKGLTLLHVLLLTYQKSLEGNSRIPSFSLNQNPGFFTIIPEIVKDFNLPGRHASKCQLHLHQQNTICQLDLQQEISDPCHGLHLLLDRQIHESEITEFPIEHRKEIAHTYRSIWRLDEKGASYYCAREISGCLVLLDPKKFKGRPKRCGNDQDDTFSVQSFALEAQGLWPETIVTVGVPSAPSITDLPSHISSHATSSTFSPFPHMAHRSQQHFDFEASPVPSSSGVVNMYLDDASESSCDTFKTAHEPSQEVLLALGLLVDPFVSQNRVCGTNDLSTDAKLPPSSPDFSGDEHSNSGGAVDLTSSATQSSPGAPLYDISFIRNVGNVCIIGSRINFVTNIVHQNGNLRAGLHTLQIKADPTAVHDSYERQKRVHHEMKAVRKWGSQLLIASSTTTHEFPLSVPRIKTSDLEEVIKDVFTWLYAASPQDSIMWLYDQASNGNTRTSLIAQFFAIFLGERRELSASYFYTGQNTQSIIPTLALQLTRCVSELAVKTIASTARDEPWLLSLSLDKQMKKLLVEPLQAASDVGEGNTHKFPRLFLIHALEDCEDEDFQSLFLQDFGESLTSLQQIRTPQKLMLLGKHTAHFEECFSTTGLRGITRLRLLPTSQDVDAD